VQTVLKHLLSINQSKTMQHLPWTDRLSLFKTTLDRIVSHLDFRSPHEYNTIAKILEQKAQFLRYEASELLSKSTEVPTRAQGLGRSAPLIESDGC
jgi:hypothetical protein